jgi:hypothetical protein
MRIDGAFGNGIDSCIGSLALPMRLDTWAAMFGDPCGEWQL